jgi:chemotaxis protein methyltransferase CheR
MHQANGIRPLSEREFRLFQELIYREAGIHLADVKMALVSGRLSRRIRALGLTDFTSYYEHVVANKDGERVFMFDAISTNETRFFREPKQFEHLQENVLPEWRALGDSGAIPKRIRAWSAACSSGEEPYTLAMVLAAHFPREAGWSVEILASDLSTRVLDTAREGVWPLERGDDIPLDWKRAYMLRGTGSQDGKMRAHPKLKELIQFRRINLNDRHYSVQGPFDLIFCRNVLIYFDRESKNGVINRLAQLLTPGGLLFLGHAESLNGAAHGLLHAGPTIYRSAKRSLSCESQASSAPLQSAAQQ